MWLTTCQMLVLVLYLNYQVQLLPFQRKLSHRESFAHGDTINKAVERGPGHRQSGSGGDTFGKHFLKGPLCVCSSGRGSESTGKTDESLRSNVPEKRPRVGKAGMRELRAGAWLVLGGQGGRSGRGPLQLGYEEAVSFSG